MRQEERRAQTVERLLDAATDVFARVGFHAATVDQIAAAAGYTKGAVYGNFESTDSLFLALIDRHLADQFAQIDELMAPGPADLRDRLARASTRQQTANGSFGLLMLEFWAYAARNEHARSQLAARYAAIRERLAAAISDRDVEEGTTSRRPADAACLVLALDAGLFLQQMLDPAAAPPDLRADAISAVLDGHAL